MPLSPLTNTTLSGLIKKLLISIDSYNSTDLSLETPTTLTVDSLGERARMCINMALHQIYDLIKDSKYLEAYPTTALSSTADQDFIDLDPEAFLDSIEAISDTTNQYKLIKKTWNWYRKYFAAPANSTGVPVYYVRRGDRIYLAPRPSGVVTYTIDFKKFTGDLKLNGDVSLLPTHYDYWIVSEAKVIWWEMEDPTAVPPLVVAERDSKRQTAIESVSANYDSTLQSSSNTEPERVGIWPWIRGTVGQ